MIDPATAQLGLSVGSKLLGGLFGGKSKAKAAKKASKAQQAAALRQEALAREYDARTQKQTEPYRAYGESSTNKLSDYLGIDSVSNDYKNADSDYSTAKAKYDALISAPKSKDIKAQPALDAKIANAKAALDASQSKLTGTTKNNARSDSFGSLLKPYKDNGPYVDNSQFNDRQFVDSNPITAPQNADLLQSSVTPETLRSFTENDLNNDVVYKKGLQFGLDQGVQGLNNRALATGSFDSGAALKELTRYGNDYGETKAAGAQQRFMGDKAFSFDSRQNDKSFRLNALNDDRNFRYGDFTDSKNFDYNKFNQDRAFNYGNFTDNRNFNENSFNNNRTFTLGALTGGVDTGQRAVGQSAGTMATALGGKTDAISGGANARSAGLIRQGDNKANMFGQFADALSGPSTFGDLYKTGRIDERGGLGGNVRPSPSYGGNVSPGIQYPRY